MQYKVPQNIDIEDKLVGPLTMLQFVYLLVGGAAVYAAFKAGWLWLAIIGAPVGLLTLAVVFLKIQGQSFSKFFFALLQYYQKPRQRRWHSLDSTGGLPAEKIPAGPIVVANQKQPTTAETKGKPRQEELRKLAEGLK